MYKFSTQDAQIKGKPEHWIELHKGKFIAFL